MPNGEGFRHGIREHPSFCSVCLNFDWEIARDLFMVREGLDLDMVYDGVSNTTPVRDVVEAATSGCGSCVVIQACAVALSDGQFDPDSEQQMEVMYASTNKLGDTTPIVFLFDGKSRSGSEGGSLVIVLPDGDIHYKDAGQQGLNCSIVAPFVLLAIYLPPSTDRRRPFCLQTHHPF